MKKIPRLLSVTVLLGAAAGAWFLFNHSSPENPAGQGASATLTDRAPSAPNRFLHLTDSKIPWETHVAELRKDRNKKYTEDEIETLLAHLNHRPESASSSWWTIANEIMAQLRLRGIRSDQLVEIFSGFIQNPDSPTVIRDYAAQHLSLWIDPKLHEDDEVSFSQDELTTAATALEKVFADPSASGTSLPGTTLRVLVDLWRNGHPAFKSTLDSLRQSQGPVFEWLERTLNQPAGEDLISQVSAVGAIGQLALEKFLPQVRSLAADDSADPTLRLNAINTLGLMGARIDQPFLESIASGNSRYRFAAKSALQSLSRNQSSNQ